MQQTNPSRQQQAGSLPAFADLARYRQQFPGLRTVSVVHDLIGRRGPVAPLLRKEVTSIANGNPVRVLDIGAYDRVLERSLRAAKLLRLYHSVDIDPTHKHDFTDMSEVTETYDLICMSELIEHLSLRDVTQLTHQAIRLLAPGGKLYISTPNPFHPTRYWGDVSHIQHWPPMDLFALLRHVGFPAAGIRMYGIIFRDPFSIRQLPRQCLYRVRNALWRLIGLESRGGIVAIATRPKSADL